MLRVRDDGCREAFSELFDRWNGQIHRLCYRMSGDYQDAEDMVQEVFGKLYRSRERYLAKSQFGAFIWKIAVNQTRDFSRREKRKETNQKTFFLNQGHQVVDGDNCKLDIADEVQQALIKLPALYREIVALRHFEGLSFAEIADLLDIPAGTVSSRMARGLKLLKELLGESSSRA